MLENSHTSNLFIRKKSDLVEFFIWGGNFFFGWSFFGGDIEVFSGGDKVLRGKSLESRVQSPESRVQGPGSSPAFRICRDLHCEQRLPPLFEKKGQPWIMCKNYQESLVHVGYMTILHVQIYRCPHHS